MKIEILKEKYKLDLVFCIIGRLVRWGSVFCPFAQGQREGGRKGKEREGSLEEWKKRRGAHVNRIGRGQKTQEKWSLP